MTPCVLRLEFGSTEAMENARKLMDAALAAPADGIVDEWSTAVATRFGAKNSSFILTVTLGFALGTAQGVAGNYVYKLLLDHGHIERTAINGQPVDLGKTASAENDIGAILRAHGCVVNGEGR